MGKVGFLGFILATAALLDSQETMSKNHMNFVNIVFLIMSTVLLLLDLFRFYESPYPFRTKMIDVILSIFLGDYYEDNRSWFNWKLNLYGNQFFAKEIRFDLYEYPVLCALEDGDSEEVLPSSEKYRRFGTAPVLLTKIQQSTWIMCRGSGMDDGWQNSEVDLLELTSSDIGKVCFRFFNVGNCHIKVRVQIDSPTGFLCVVAIYRAGGAEKFAEHVEYLTEGKTVLLLFAYFQEFQHYPVSGVVDMRRGGLHKKQKVACCFRIQDAMSLMKSNRCVLIKCTHIDHSLWIL